MKKAYEIQVKDDGEFTPVIYRDCKNYFESRAAAEKAVAEHKTKFPYRLTMRVVKI